MKFEWDPQKAAANLRKHKVSFEYAARVFLDPLRVDGVDTRENYGEDRWITVGYVEGRLLVVAYTERAGVIRLISARKASVREQKIHIDAV